ncbi:MAG TPA: hypothetical protein VFZ09_32715 [Archangium sp.]|uniref:hypothetical protein n=1 Tax=Archangium sp. TaxID=1872627 RepID=UPI002E381A65|nr:hypothetical protein [Archangium sp.]HEX5751035.1 hypothetical protein [Archangium sp.]
MAGAQELRDARPGVTTGQEVLRSFGRPTRRTPTPKGGTVLSYQRTAAPEGTRGAFFTLDAEGLLQRIDVIPKRPPTRASLEKTHGPECSEDTPPERPCYEVQRTPRGFALNYARLGLLVNFEKKRVKSLTYVAPAPEPESESESESESEPLASTPEPSSGSGTASGELDMSLRPAAVESSEPESESESESGAGPESAPAEPRTLASAPTASETAREAESLQRTTLAMGGRILQQGYVSGSRLGPDTRMRPSIPALVDLYLDATPGSSFRGFVVGRLVYDPLDQGLSGPRVILDQLWLRFDVASRVFFTLGRQQIKWGSSRIWNPTDFLQRPNPQPLEAFDLRTGVDMLKVNIPFEPLSSNLSLFATADLNGPAGDPLRYGGAVRAEVAVGTSEFAASAAFLQGRRPRFGLDWSMGAGPFDLNAELALVQDTTVGLWQRTADGFEPREFGGPKLLASAGVNTQLRFADVYRLGLRLEGFYNSLGYEDRSYLTWLIAQDDYQPLFFGRYYAMGQLSFTRRSIYVPTLNFTVLSNVLDRSFYGRVDFMVVPITELKVFAFVEAPFGQRGTEFRFVPDPAIAPLPATGLSLFRVGFSVQMRM